MNETIKYYYLRDKAQNRPIVTICLLMNEGKYSKGIAVYNEADFKTGCCPLCKKTGKHIALAYARKAMGTKTSSLPITKLSTLTFLSDSLEGSAIELGPYVKSQYMPNELTKHERNLLKL